MRRAVFAWEGFSFSHPEDWCPVSLTGSRQQGYARLQGPGRIGCQVRWQMAPRRVDLDFALDNYLRLLERDAKRSKVSLRTEKKLEEGVLLYRWVGATQGRGAIVASKDERLFVLEVVGGAGDSLLPQAKALIGSFWAERNQALERWSLFGMTIRLPSGLTPVSKTLQSGRTWLTFRPRGASIEAGRYAFGTELVAKHGLEPWARAALDMRLGSAESQSGRLRLRTVSKLTRKNSTALVKLDELNNQIVVVRTTSKSPKWNPEWEWLDSNAS